MNRPPFEPNSEYAAQQSTRPVLQVSEGKVSTSCGTEACGISGRSLRPARQLPFGVHVYEKWGVTTFTIVDRDGEVLREVSMPSRIVSEEDFDEMRSFLARREQKLRLLSPSE